MNTSPTAPRAALVARARKHFAAIAASSLLLTGGLAAVTAAQSLSTPPDTAGPSIPGANGSGPAGSPGSSGSRSSDSSGSTGLTSPQRGSSPDAGSNAS